MPVTFTISLAALVALLVVFRVVRVVTRSPAVPGARPIAPADAVLVAIAVLALALHCGAMFHRDLVGLIPGTGGVSGMINAMGVASFILYAVPALILLIGLRRQSRPAVAVLALTLVAVGVTMYNGGSVNIHLVTIFASVTVLAGIVTLLISRVMGHRTVVAT